MKQNYDACFQMLIGHEGGLSMDTRDPGNYTPRGVLKGTKYGISAQAYPNLDIRNRTLDDAKAIYRRDYWNAIGADALPAGLDLAAFDLAVNSGPGTARRFLGLCGDSWSKLIALRLEYMQSLAIWRTYGRGWASRLNTLRGQCAALEQAAAQARTPGVILIDSGGHEVAWNGAPAPYGGLPLSAALIAQLRTVYPNPGGPWLYQGLKVYLRRNGDLVLEKPLAQAA